MFLRIIGKSSFESISSLSSLVCRTCRCRVWSSFLVSVTVFTSFAIFSCSVSFCICSQFFITNSFCFSLMDFTFSVSLSFFEKILSRASDLLSPFVVLRCFGYIYLFLMFKCFISFSTFSNFLLNWALHSTIFNSELCNALAMSLTLHEQSEFCADCGVKFFPLFSSFFFLLSLEFSSIIFGSVSFRESSNVLGSIWSEPGKESVSFFTSWSISEAGLPPFKHWSIMYLIFSNYWITQCWHLFPCTRPFLVV